MDSASDTVYFDPLVIWFNTGWLIGDVNRDGGRTNTLSMVTQILCLQRATIRNILSLSVWLVSQMEFRLHGEIISVHSVDCRCQNVWLSPPSLGLLSLHNYQPTSCNNLVATGLLSPFISCQPSGLLGAQTRTGSYNRLFVGESANVCVCVFTNERSWIWAMRGAHPHWWTAPDGFPPPHSNMGHGHEGSSDGNTDQSSPTWFTTRSDWYNLALSALYSMGCSQDCRDT